MTYSRSKAILICPYCQSDFVVEEEKPIMKMQPLRQDDVMRRAHPIPDDDYYFNDDLVDMPQIPSRNRMYEPDYSDLYVPQPSRGGPMTIYPRNPLTGSSRPPELGIYDRGNRGELFYTERRYDQFDYPPRQPPRNPYPIPHDTTKTCVYCHKVIKEDDDYITMSCSHQCHAACLKKGECPTCSSLYC